MKPISVLGIDLAKHSFQLHGVDEDGKVVVRRKTTRAGLLKFIAGIKPCLIGVEASGGSRYFVREFKKYGHDAKLIAPQFVKPFVKSDKNDANDAEAICEAVQRPNMRFVAEKTLEQQTIQMLHRVRARRVASRTELCNEIRALLSDYGIIAPQGLSKLKEKVHQLLSTQNDLEGWFLRELQLTLSEWNALEENIQHSDEFLSEVYQKYEVCKRLTTIPGVGKITATAIIGAVGNINSFKTARHLSAWFGLVPRQNSTGGKQKLSGITKRGDKYLRSLLIHGGRAVVRQASRYTDSRSIWIMEKVKTRGKNKAAVAVANKNARVIWKLLKTQESYRVA